MLVVAPGDDDGLDLQGVKSRAGAGGAGADGVIDVGDAVQDAHLLQPVFHTGESHGHLTADLITDKALNSGKGGQVVEQVMLARELDLLSAHDLLLLCAVYAQDHAVFADHAPVHPVFIGKIAHRRMGKMGVIGAVLIIKVQNQLVILVLMLKLRPLCVDIILIVLVLIQVVGGNVGDDGHIGLAVHAVELEGAELQHSDIVCHGLRNLTQPRVADVAAQMHPVPGGLQQLGNNRRCRGLSVAACHRNGLAGAEGKEHLHL